MFRQTPGSLLLVAAVAGGFGFVAFVALMVVGGVRVSPAAFFAILVAAGAGAVFFLGAHPTGPRNTSAAMPTPDKDGRMGNVTRKAGTAGVTPGTAGVGAGTAGAKVGQGGVYAKTVPGGLPSHGALKPDHTAEVAGAAPSAATGGMPDPKALGTDAGKASEGDRGLSGDRAIPREAAVDMGAGTDEKTQPGVAAGVPTGSGAAADGSDAVDGSIRETGEAHEHQRSEGSYVSVAAPVSDPTDTDGDETPAAEDSGVTDEAAGASEGKTVIGTEPPRLDSPREGGADDLKKLNGVGAKMEESLNRLGFYHLDQIAAWNENEAAWVDERLEGVKGRVTRDDWVGQAKEMTKG